MTARRFFVGVDIGGTFTDLVIAEAGSARTRDVKLLTTPDRPVEGVMRAVEEGLAAVSGRPDEIERFVHATTLPTNLVLEQRGARVAFVTTAGFGDVFEIGRQYPWGRARFDLRWQRPRPLVQREHVIEIDERMGFDGSTRRPLDRTRTLHQLDGLAVYAPESFAVCLLHSYANPAHEYAVAELIRGRFAGLHVSLSCEVWPEIGEYERSAATALSAYVGPVLAGYLAELEARLRALGVRAPLQVMQSSGAIMSAAEVSRRAVYAIESGPAAGVMATAHLARACGRPDLLSFDMGGTTAKTGLIKGGAVRMAQDFRVGGRVSASGTREIGEPIRIPVVDLAEVGAGGGSIAWVDAGGHLQVGPQSAGADPGPACYGRGGEFATVTDANLTLGYLDPAGFDEGRLPLRPDLAAAAIERSVAGPLGTDLVTAARGIYDLANMRMGSAIRMVTLQRGTDPREQAIVAFGGAGPLHVVRLAQLFDMPEAIVPPAPGVKSAYGLLVSDLASDHVRTCITDLSSADPLRLHAIFAELEAQGRAELGAGAREAACLRSLDLRYSQKAQTQNVELAPGEITADALARAEADFRRAQFAFYGTHSDDRCEIVSLRVRLAQSVEKPELPALRGSVSRAGDARKGARRAWFAEALDFVDTPVYAREKLPQGELLSGPALIEEAHSTTVCPPGVSFALDRFGNIVIANPRR